MPRSYRLLAIATLAVLLFSAAPAAAAPAAGWSLFDRFSPFDWLRHLWDETGSGIDPWGEPEPALKDNGSGIDPSGTTRQIWAETGSMIDPWGRPEPVLNDTGNWIDPLCQQ